MADYSPVSQLRLLPMTPAPPTHSQDGFLHLHHRKDPIDRKRKLALLASYAPDWILTILVAGLFFLLNTIEPFKREFSLDDTSIQHTYTVHERVPDSSLFLIALVAPLVIMAIINVISIRSFWDLHTSWLGAILALALTGSVTNVVKVTVGRPRPDCIDRCQPQQGAANHPVSGLVNATICTQTDNAILKDGFRSFPSGHSSLSFAGLGFLSFYLAGKLHLFDQRGHTGKAWISIVPLMGAALVAVTRTMDYRHHWHDVLIGSLLGFFLAWFSYRQYYPGLSDPISHRPYSPRVSRIHTPLPHLHDGVRRSSEQVDAEHLRRPSPDEDMELQATSRSNTAVSQTKVPVELPEVWKEGEGQEELLPPGQASEHRPADEQV